MSHIAQKRPFASLVEEEEFNDPTTSSTINSPAHEQEEHAALAELRVEQQHEEEQQVEMTAQEKRFCLSLLKQLMKHKRAYAFNQPVDPVAFNIPDYFDVIKQPMDLGTVNEKLNQDRYPTFQSVLDDIELIFYNCYLYNNITDPVCQDAKKLEEYYHKQLRKAPANLVAAGGASAVQQPAAAIPLTITPLLPPVTATQSIQPTTNKIKINLRNNTVSTAPVSATSMDQVGNSIPPQENTTAAAAAAAVPFISTPQPATLPEAPTLIALSQPQQQVQQQQKPSVTVKLPALPTPPPTTAATTASKTNSEGADKVELMPDDQFKRCEAIVKELKKPKHYSLYWPFELPVDATAWGAHDYYDIIKHPMDMQTYERKLYEFEYAHEDELAEDIRLMFRNCYQYNPPGHDVHNLGKQFEKVFEEHWEKLHQQKRPKAASSSGSGTITGGSSSKKRRVSRDVSSSNIAYQPIPSTTTSTIVEPPTTVQQEGGDVNNHNITVDHTAATTSTPPPMIKTEQPSQPQQPPAHPAIKLRLKLGPKPQVKEENPPPKQKHAGLAITKEPSSSGPKLAIADTPPVIHTTNKQENSSQKEQKLANEASWYKLANQATTAPSGNKYHHTNTITPRNSPPPSSGLQRQGSQRISPPLNNHKPRISSPPTTAQTAQTAQPPQPPPPQPKAPVFDIFQTVNKIESQKKEWERQEKEKAETFQRNEKIRLEKERIRNEEKLQRIREFNQKAQVLREQDKLERIESLKHYRCDISQQKMMFKNYTYNLNRDQDWIAMNKYYDHTLNYRGFPRLPFVDRSGVNIDDLKRKLLSKCARLRNQAASAAAAAAAAHMNSNNNNGYHLGYGSHGYPLQQQEDDGDSDMDVEEGD